MARVTSLSVKPPSIPPKPTKSIHVYDEVNIIKSNVISGEQEMIYEAIDYPMPFNKLVSDYAKNLPFQVDISESLYGVLGGGSIFHGEEICLHFLKETDALIAKCGYEMYYVPVCSSYQCNIGLYKDDPLALTDFSSMVKLLSSSALPKVVCIANGAEPVKTGELLLVKELNHLRKKDKVDSITCWSITEQKKKCLNKSCTASFNVAPEATKVYLRDIIDHCQLPMTVQLYTTGTSTTMLTINERLFVKSVIASKQKKPDELFEIVASIDMMAKKLEISASDTKELQKHTTRVYEAFHPSQITTVISSAKASCTRARAKLCTSVLDDWKNYIKLVPLTSILPEKKFPKQHAPIVLPKPSSTYQNTTLQQSRKMNRTKTSPCPVDTMAHDNTQPQSITTNHDDTSATKPAVYNDVHKFPIATSKNTSRPIRYETILNDNKTSNISIEEDCCVNASAVSSTQNESEFTTIYFSHGSARTLEYIF